MIESNKQILSEVQPFQQDLRAQVACLNALHIYIFLRLLAAIKICNNAFSYIIL